MSWDCPRTGHVPGRGQDEDKRGQIFFGYLDEDAMEKRLNFCKKIIDMNLEGKNIFFTDETKVDTAPNISNESIRVSSRIKNKIKKGDKEGYNKINRETKKYEPSIILAGGVSFYGLSDLILLKGTMTEFSYAQALEYYKEKYDEFKKENDALYFERSNLSYFKKSEKIIGETFWR